MMVPKMQSQAALRGNMLARVLLGSVLSFQVFALAVSNSVLAQNADLPQLAVEKADVAIALKQFDAQLALGGDRAEALQILLDTLKLNPEPDQRLRLYQLILRHSHSLKDITTAVEFTERLCTEYPTEADACDQALLTLARSYAAHEQPQKGRETLERILELHPAGSMKGLIHLELSTVFADQKDEAAMLSHLKMAAESPSLDVRSNIMDPNNTRQIAVVRLGRHFQQKGDFVQALEYFRAWKFGGWCGNCLAAFKCERDLYIAQCLVELGSADEALRDHLLPHLTRDEGNSYCSAEIPALALRIYEQKNDLDGFVNFIKPHANAEFNRAAQIARDLAKIRVERRAGRIKQLIDRLRNSEEVPARIRDLQSNWRAAAAAQALSEFSGKEYPALRERYDYLLNQKDARLDYETRIWVLYAIGLSRSADASLFLEGLLKQGTENPKNMLRTIGVSLDDVRYAISLQSPRETVHDAGSSAKSTKGKRDQRDLKSKKPPVDAAK